MGDGRVSSRLKGANQWHGLYRYLDSDAWKTHESKMEIRPAREYGAWPT